jgi:hypothetical protein
VIGLTYFIHVFFMTESFYRDLEFIGWGSKLTGKKRAIIVKFVNYKDREIKNCCVHSPEKRNKQTI